MPGFEICRSFHRQSTVKTLQLAALPFIALLSSTSHAQEIAGKTQLGLGLGLLSFAKGTAKLDVAGADDVETTSTSFGTLESSTVTLGYGVTNHFVIGVDLTASFETQSQDDSDDISGTELSIAPVASYVFAGATLRPFLSASIGVATGSTDSGDVETSTTAFGFSGAVGVHCFATESVSLSPSLGLGYAIGSTTAESGGFEVDGDIGVFAVNLGVTLSAWL